MVESFEIQLKNGAMAKFSIWKSAFKSETAYFAKVIELTKISPKNNFGKILRSGEKTIYYANSEQLKADLITFYTAGA